MFCEQFRCLFHSLFGGDSFVHLHQPLDVNFWLKPHNYKNIWHLRTFKLSKEHQNQWRIVHNLTIIVLPPIQVPFPGCRFIYNITFSTSNIINQYEMIIENFSTHTCMAFIKMIASSLGEQGKWVHYKHVYYILQHVMFCG